MEKIELKIEFTISEPNGEDRKRDVEVHMHADGKYAQDVARLADVLEKSLVAISQVVLQTHDEGCKHWKRSKQIIDFFTH